MDSYRTIARSGVSEIEVKRSRFLGHVVRVDSDSSARKVIIEARKKHHDARHHCSAFVLRPDASIQRSNDDGEPGGTAGAPMLEVINGKGLSDVVAVVTRYFGGTLLGSGGLVRAYGDAVAAALEEAGVRERLMHQVVDVTVPAADAGRIDNQLRMIATVREVAYREEAVLTVLVAARDLEQFEEQVARISAGAARIEVTGTEWLDYLR